jgi:TetR/AcrR family transcriptional repressor of nem operon
MTLVKVSREKPVEVAILDVAQDLVQRRGYNAFSYHDLADQIGVKTSSIHYYFPSKGDLGCALMRRYREQVAQRLADIDAAQTDASEKLRQCAELFVGSLCCGDGKLCMAGMLATDLMTLPNEVQAEVRGFFVELEAWVATVLANGYAAGVFRFAGSPEHAARTFVATIEGALIAARAFGDSQRIVDTTTWFVSTISAELVHLQERVQQRAAGRK